MVSKEGEGFGKHWEMYRNNMQSDIIVFQGRKDKEIQTNNHTVMNPS